MANLNELKAKVEELKTVRESVVALITGLVQRIKDLEPSQEAIDALAADVDSEVHALADAVTAGTV